MFRLFWGATGMKGSIIIYAWIKNKSFSFKLHSLFMDDLTFDHTDIA